MSSGGRPYFSGPLLVLGLLAILWNHILGPGCTAHVVTGVQTALLPSVVRRRKARKVLAAVVPAIREIQAGVVVQGPAGPAGPPPLPSQVPPPLPTPPP